MAFQSERQQRGFTLVELMIVLSIAAIILLVAIPSFERTYQRNAMTSSLGDIMSMVAKARTEAVSRNLSVTLCGSNDQASCNTNSWEEGWIVIETATPGNVIYIGQPLRRGMTLRTLNFPNAGEVVIEESGWLTSMGTFRLCDARGVAEMRAVNVSRVGQPRIAVDEDSNGTVDDTAGGEIGSCT